MTVELATLKAQLEGYTMQRDTIQVNFQQLTGAIHVLEDLIKKMEAGESIEMGRESIENVEINN